MVCRECGKQFKAFPSRIKNGRSLYCSRSCSSAMKVCLYKGRDGVHRYGPDNPNWKGIRIPKNCPVCGDIFVGPSRTCSVKCGHILQAIHVSREANGNWVNREIWLRRHYREIILKAGSVCSRCGRKNGLLVHHRNGNRTDNATSNLAILCPSCHQYVHDPSL